MIPDAELLDAPMELLGRIVPASNGAYLAQIGQTRVIYKPEAGERPLWDFPGARLALRERATFLVSEALGWGVVPTTWVRDGPGGDGMVQVWQDVDPEQDAVDVVPLAESDRPGWRMVFEGQGPAGEPLAVIHEDTSVLRHIAILDVIVNNADRKGGHVLAMADGHRHGIDHGLTFHREDKLRTVLWGWAGEPFTADEVERVAAVRDAVREGELGGELAGMIDPEELDELRRRLDALVAEPVFPLPPEDRMAIPWPPF